MNVKILPRITLALQEVSLLYRSSTCALQEIDVVNKKKHDIGFHASEYINVM